LGAVARVLEQLAQQVPLEGGRAIKTWYNEIDPYCAEWLRNLIAAGHLPAGDVDERDIRDIRPGELQGYRQHHFFAGIGGWPLALRLAGWDDAAPIWTGSCPCQPFSAAGKRLGAADERHLWPFWHFLVEQCRPPVVLGEQVASKAGRSWLAGVRLDLEALGYAVGGADLPAAGVGANHNRPRLFFVADALRHGSQKRGLASACGKTENTLTRCTLAGNGGAAWLDWSAEPGIQPRIDGLSGHVAPLRAYGNAIVPQIAAEFVRAWMECRPD
jgi:DNA (cytosine-5)-methyltransferase 1